jgi:hypothetical protein
MDQSAVEFLKRQYNFNKQLFLQDFIQAKEMENEQKILLVEELKAYTKEAQCILGNDEREASEFVDIFNKTNFKTA